MDTPISSSSSSSFIAYFLLSLCLVCSLEEEYTTETHHNTHHTVQLTSLLPPTVCTSSPSTKDNYKEGSLKVVHKHGPCSQHHEDKATVPPSHSEILLQDQSRVNSIRSRVLKNRKQTNAAVDVEAKSGDNLGSGNYIVTVGLGTPKKDLSLIFDTGSPLTWTQCVPCSRTCYSQKEPMFDPSKSSTYVNVSCKSAVCSLLTSSTGYTPECASETSTCIYGIQYGDQSYSVGYFGRERITLSKYDVFDGFLFGCGHKNRGLYGRTAGLLGLGRDTISIVQQTSNIYKRIFSYCLPTHSSSSTGHLTFGRTPVSSRYIKYTPLSKSTDIDDSFYALDLEGITVAGTKLSIPSSIFSSPGTIIDSGTVITRLPATVYKALRSTFRQFMSSYPRAPALSILDTCYDFSSYSSFRIPKISFLFGGGIAVELQPQGILYAAGAKQICLAFAGYSGDDEVAIFGNAQQQTLEVVYDVDGGRIGFGPAEFLETDDKGEIMNPEYVTWGRTDPLLKSGMMGTMTEDVLSPTTRLRTSYSID